jgi:hypothetical protein
MENEKEQTKADLTQTEDQVLTIPVGLYVAMKSELLMRRSGRPVVIPDDLTTIEYNFLVKQLTAQRVKILNTDPKIPKPIKEAKK